MRKKAFTLFEIMVVIAIIAAIAPLLFSNLKKTLQHWHFTNSIALVQEEAENLHHLSLIYQIDTSLIIYKSGKEYLLKVESNEPIKGLVAKPIKLPGIQNVVFNKTSTEQFSCTFYSSGKQDPLGILELKGNDKNEVYLINFKFPFNISGVKRFK